MNFRIFSVVFCTELLVINAQVSQKKGVVHRVEEYKCGDFEALSGIFWWYDYRNSITYFLDHDNCTTSIDQDTKDGYVPMVWGLNTEIQIQSDTTYLLGYNEPTHMKQSNLSPLEAANGWKNLVKKAKGIELVSPSASECGVDCTGTTLTWFKEFFKLCRGGNCRVDFIATHTYKCDADKVLALLKTLTDTYHKKIWLTEFACGNVKHPELQLIFMKMILPKLEAEDYIYRYSWYKGRIPESKDGSVFMYPAASLLQPNSPDLTPLGTFYNTYQREDVVSFGDISIPNDGPSDLIDEEAAQQELVIGAKKAEVLAILGVYYKDETEWWKILNSVKNTYNYMPWQVGAFYMTAEKMDAKSRIKSIFEIFLCNTNHILDDEIRTEVERINKMPRLKIKGTLRLPVCS